MFHRYYHLGFKALIIYGLLCICLKVNGQTNTNDSNTQLSNTTTAPAPPRSKSDSTKSFRGSVEFGVTGGITTYRGDLGDNLFNQSQFRWNFGGFFQANSKWFSFRFGYSRARIYGDDLFYEKEGQQKRALHFRNDIHEASFTIHWHLLGYGTKAGRVFSPAFFAGAAFITSNPQARVYLGNGQSATDFESTNDTKTGAAYLSRGGEFAWFNLRDIGTEGQTATVTDVDANYVLSPPKPYKKWAIAIPVGLELPFIIKKRFVIAPEIGLRFALTDYLDDVGGQYYDRSDGHQALVAANQTLTDSDGNPYNPIFATILANPSYINTLTGGNPSQNDAYTTPNAKRGNDKKFDWYMMIGLRFSVIIGGKHK